MNKESSIPIVSPSKALPLQASKWLKWPVLIDEIEMESLLRAMNDFFIFQTGVLESSKILPVPNHEFLKRYSNYIHTLREGGIPDLTDYRQLFSSVITTSACDLFGIKVLEDKYLIRTQRPVIQMQLHTFSFSPVDLEFRSMNFGQDSVLWGIQFSYPQIFQEPETKEEKKVGNGELFPNTILFRNLQNWMRSNTIPTPFLFKERIFNIPIRLGKNCLRWINQHPQLSKKGLEVRT